MLRIKTRLSVYVGISIFLASGSFAVFAQADELSLTDIPNGFKGTFKSGGRTLTITSSEGADRSLQTRITNVDGSLIAGAAYRNNLVTLTLSDTSINFRTDRESVASQRVEPLSSTDRARLETYVLSDEASIVRKMIVEIIKQKASIKPVSLKGILIISLILGDGPGFPNSTSQKADGATKCNPPKALQIFASYASPPGVKSQSTSLRKNMMECNESNCCGCCGPGCEGCTGCYTIGCLLHDVCVDEYGALHPRCLLLLPAAMQSILDECLGY